MGEKRSFELALYEEWGGFELEEEVKTEKDLKLERNFSKEELEEEQSSPA